LFVFHILQDLGDLKGATKSKKGAQSPKDHSFTVGDSRQHGRHLLASFSSNLDMKLNRNYLMHFHGYQLLSASILIGQHPYALGGWPPERGRWD
jgi:hypothetical protein